MIAAILMQILHQSFDLHFLGSIILDFVVKAVKRGKVGKVWKKKIEPVNAHIHRLEVSAEYDLRRQYPYGFGRLPNQNRGCLLMAVGCFHWQPEWL